ncbi:hypothetical protein BDV06DRAFT_220644 [Aspergillus oleicola]
MNYCPHLESTPRKACIFRVTIAPHFDDANCADHLSVHLVLENQHCAAHTALFQFETCYENVPAHPYTERDIAASDAAGTLNLYFTKVINPNRADQEWRPERETIGDVHLRFTAMPRKVDVTTPIGPRVDLRRDQGGLMGSVVGAGGNAGVVVVGEGPSPVRKDGGPGMLANSVFMVGPVKSYPPGPRPVNNDETLAGSAAGAAGADVSPTSANIYWFGQLPENLSQLNAYNTALFPKLAAFFQTVDASYRYDENSWKESDDELVSLFSHEMVHSFTMMGVEADGYNNGWYIEGIAELYSVYLPYRFGLCGADYLRNRLNSSLCSYGTSPRIEMDVLESQERFYDDCRLRKITGRFELKANSPLDDIVVEMGRRWRKGEQLLAKDWLKYLRPYFGNVMQEFQDMLRGKFLDLSHTIVVHENWSLAPTMQEILDFGFDKSSIDKRIISGVVPNSRAVQAGLEDGLRLLSISRAGICSKSLSAKMSLLVEKRGVKMHISYWPRSFSKAKVWQLGS